MQDKHYEASRKQRYFCLLIWKQYIVVTRSTYSYRKLNSELSCLLTYYLLMQCHSSLKKEMAQWMNTINTKKKRTKQNHHFVNETSTEKEKKSTKVIISHILKTGEKQQQQQHTQSNKSRNKTAIGENEITDLFNFFRPTQQSAPHTTLQQADQICIWILFQWEIKVPLPLTAVQWWLYYQALPMTKMKSWAQIHSKAKQIASSTTELRKLCFCDCLSTPFEGKHVIAQAFWHVCS